MSPLDRDEIERANLRHLIDYPEDIAIVRDSALGPRDFANPQHRRAFEAILKAAETGAAIPDEVLMLLAARP